MVGKTVDIIAYVRGHEDCKHISSKSGKARHSIHSIHTVPMR